MTLNRLILNRKPPHLHISSPGKVLNDFVRDKVLNGLFLAFLPPKFESLCTELSSDADPIRSSNPELPSGGFNLLVVVVHGDSTCAPSSSSLPHRYVGLIIGDPLYSLKCVDRRVCSMSNNLRRDVFPPFIRSSKLILLLCEEDKEHETAEDEEEE